MDVGAQRPQVHSEPIKNYGHSNSIVSRTRMATVHHILSSVHIWSPESPRTRKGVRLERD